MPLGQEQEQPEGEEVNGIHLTQQLSLSSFVLADCPFRTWWTKCPLDNAEAAEAAEAACDEDDDDDGDAKRLRFNYLSLSYSKLSSPLSVSSEGLSCSQPHPIPPHS